MHKLRSKKVRLRDNLVKLHDQLNAIHQEIPESQHIFGPDIITLSEYDFPEKNLEIVIDSSKESVAKVIHKLIGKVKRFK